MLVKMIDRNKYEDVGSDAHSAMLDLLDLLIEFSKEIGKFDENRPIQIESFLRNHSAIYIVYDDGIAVGFASYVVNDRYGISDTVVTNDFLFVSPEKRGTKAIYFLMLQTGRIVEDMGLPLEHCYASAGSSRLGKRLEGKKEYTSYVYTVNEVLREYSKLKRIVKIKD